MDLLVIMIGLPTAPNVYFLKPGRKNVPSTVYHPRSAVHPLIAENILFLHAMSGCDTTSALFNQGKNKFIKTLANTPDLGATLAAFKDSSAAPQTIQRAGEQFLVALYGGNMNEDLNIERFRLYKRSAFKTRFNIATLPPTHAAAQQHSLRVFYQVQAWSGNQMDPTLWGWSITPRGLMPTTTLLPCAPDKLLQLVACKCTQQCMRNCGC